MSEKIKTLATLNNYANVVPQGKHANETRMQLKKSLVKLTPNC